ncbi:MAG: helix-turn-helix domain-containing protein [Candidatus Dojkabacteria bacterium]
MVNPELYKIGQKIRNFRIRAGLSQLELEIKMGAAPSSLSRIENGEVNPSKETLSKISSALNLNAIEIASLQNLEIFTPEEVMNAISIFTKSLDIDEIITNVVDILFQLYPKYNGGVILLTDDNNKNILRSRAVSNMPNIAKVYELLGGGVDQYFFKLNESNPDLGLIVKTFLTGEKYTSNLLRDFSKGTMPDYIPDIISKMLGFGIGISVPIDIEGERIGIMLYTKSTNEPFSEYEQKILDLLTKQIGIAVMNGKKFKELKSKRNSE